MSEKQKTIKEQSITLKGNGLHTGVEVEMCFKPAAENFGIRFKRVDLENQPEVRAIADNVTDTSRSTTIEEKGAKIGTIEHVMSALAGLGIDNVLIEINNAETPILDGSAKPFVQALQQAGIVEQEAEKNFFRIKENLTYSNPEKGIELTLIPEENYSINVMIDYNSKVLGSQFASTVEFKGYDTEIAPSKTFVFTKELEFLAKNNLIKGGSLDSALVIMEEEMSQEKIDELAKLLGKPSVDFSGRKGILNEKDLIFANEPARHKLLDLSGDLALVGIPFKGKVFATRPGHFSNVEFAKIIRQHIKAKQKENRVDFDIFKEPVMDVNKIKQLMPHRYPFLLVDKIIEMSKTVIVGVKNLTFNEAFFQGHFPTEPVMPGVLQIEAMAQTGGILVLNNVDEPEKYSTYFLKIDKVKFKSKAVPGDVLVFRLEMTEPIRRGVVTMKGQTFVNGQVISEGEFMALVTKNK
ncbi:MAG: bifunctional UDP-3-O-[Bacteroidales bacterium]|nr:bifunctional UDP-3-O-[3-hydroxymyristoyl] N-acetylglucosamine deacetylase/3-hydroxyacyl-ACP dehydratase [Bacteroidales bacterium]